MWVFDACRRFDQERKSPIDLSYTNSGTLLADYPCCLLRAGCSTISINYTGMLQGSEACEALDCPILQLYGLLSLCIACGEAGSLDEECVIAQSILEEAAKGLPRSSVVRLADSTISHRLCLLTIQATNEYPRIRNTGLITGRQRTGSAWPSLCEIT